MTIAVSGIWVAAADPADQRAEFPVPSVQAADSLHTFAAAKLNYFFRDPAPEHVVTNAVQATFTPDDPLEQMLTGTPLTFEKLNERTIALRICRTPCNSSVSSDSENIATAKLKWRLANPLRGRNVAWSKSTSMEFVRP